MKKDNKKILTKYWDVIDPQSLEDYVAKGGYRALLKALKRKPLEVVEEIKESGLQGRGGGGFPAGQKWEIAARLKAKEKYLICNLDESEPGTFKDRYLAEKDPHRIIEGIIISAYALGAKKAYLYLNHNFKTAEFLLKRAIETALVKKYLGSNILNSDFSLELELFVGAGAYICGEESALINSLEGKRGEPRRRPPFVCNCGLFNRPTVVNNAETLANVPWIIKYGAERFKTLGEKGAFGTKLFCLDGAVNQPGIYEVPLGTSVRELIYQVAKGMQPGKEFWLAQVGGSAGRLVTQGLLDEKPGYGEARIPLGSGAVLVMDKSQNLKALMLSWVRFFQRESCGQCVPCREGLFRLKAILERLQMGDFNQNDLADLKKIIWTLEHTTFCGLGKFSVTGIKDVLKYKLVDELS